MGADDNEIVQPLLKALVTKHTKLLFIAGGAGLVLSLHTFNTGLTESVSTAGSLVGLTEHMQTYGTVELKLTRLFDKFTLKARLKWSSSG